MPLRLTILYVYIVGAALCSLSRSVDSSINVFISQENLQEYFPNLTNDSEVYIIYNGVSSILNDSSLKFNTGVPVPLFPLSVDEVIISWRTSKTATYQIHITEISEGILQMPVLSIPFSGYLNNTDEFSISMVCADTNPGSIGEVYIELNITTDIANDDITVEFFLEKDCTAIEGSSSIITSTFVKVTPTSSLLFSPLLEVIPTASSVAETVFLPSLVQITSLIPTQSTLILIPSIETVSTIPLIPSIEAVSTISLIPSVDSTSTISSIPPVESTSTILLMPSVETVSTISSIPPVESTSTISSIPPVESTSTILLMPSVETVSTISSIPPVESTSTISSIPPVDSTSTISSIPPVDSTSTLSSIPPVDSTSTISSIPPVDSTSIPSVESTPSSLVKTAFTSLSKSSTGIILTSSMQILSSSAATPTPSLVESSSLVTPSTTIQEPMLWMLFTIVFAPIVGFLLICILFILCCLCCIKCARKKNSHQFSDYPYEIPFEEGESEEESLDKYKKLETPISIWMSLPWGNVITLPLSIQSLIKSLNIDRRKMAITNTFLKGANGCLSRGMLMMDRVNPSSEINIGTIFKIFIAERGRREDVSRFIEQTTLMHRMEHKNILPLLGLSVEDNCVPIALYPFTEYGNLHVFLELSRLMPEESPLNPFTRELKINFSCQLASAMNFLSENKIIHPDLALRNCWLDIGFTLKLSDGALSQEFFPDSYANIKGAVRPVKWSAIETLQEGLITSQSNVWSYGVTVWEIFAVAKEPYGDISNKTITSHLMMDGRLPCPSEDCPDALFSLLQTCWNTRGEERPRFGTLHKKLKDLNNQYSPSSHQPQHPLRNSYRYSDYNGGPLSPDVTCTTFGKDILRQPMVISVEQYPEETQRYSGNEQIRRHSGHRGSKRSIDHHLSSSSIGRVSKVSLSFSVLDDTGGNISSSSDSEEDGGSFPSTLKSRTSGNNVAAMADIITESMATLQPTTPNLPLDFQAPPLSISPDIPSKTSASNRSSIVNQATSGTDRSSFYSTGIDSISTTQSTPLPSSSSVTNHNIELKTYATNEDHGMLHPISARYQGQNDTPESISPQTMTTPFKSTDSGIRSDDESNSSTGSHNMAPNVTTNTTKTELRHPQIDNLTRDSLHSSRTSFGLGLMDMSSELMATFDSFSTFKPNL